MSVPAIRFTGIGLAALLFLSHPISAQQKTPTEELSFQVCDEKVSEVQRLLAAGAEVNAKSKYCIDGTSLHVAAYRGNKEIAEMLIAHGADINARDDRGGTPLHVAVRRGWSDMVAFLIVKCADLAAKDKSGLTPMLIAQPTNPWQSYGDRTPEEKQAVIVALLKSGQNRSRCVANKG